nr:phage portal protein [Streptococcus suis]
MTIIARKFARTEVSVGLLDVFTFKKSASFDESLGDDGEIKEISQNIALKSAALSKVANYVGRSLSKAKFVLKGVDTSNYSDWLYLLNVRPNPNQSASEFLSEIGKKLIKDGEVLLVVVDRKLYVAESYSTEETSLKGNRYRVSTIQGMTVDDVFEHDKVIFIENENDSLATFTEQLWADYGELLGRLINRQKTANQIRFTLGLPKDQVREKAQELADGKGKQNVQQKFFQRVVERIKKDSVVAIPLNKDGAYNEYSNCYSSKASFVDDIKQVKNQYIDDVCEMVGIPPALIHGELADNQKNHEQMIEVVIEPIIRKLIDGLQVAIFSEGQYAEGNYIKATGLLRRDLFDIAASGDKLIAAGLAMADEIREEIGLSPLPNGLGQRLYITKNYLELREEGGTKDDDSANQGANHSEQS